MGVYLFEIETDQDYCFGIVMRRGVIVPGNSDSSTSGMTEVELNRSCWLMLRVL